MLGIFSPFASLTGYKPKVASSLEGWGCANVRVWAKPWDHLPCKCSGYHLNSRWYYCTLAACLALVISIHAHTRNNWGSFCCDSDPCFPGEGMRLGRWWDLHKVIVMVEFCVPLARLRADQGAEKAFPGVSVKVFPEEIMVVSRLSNADGPLQCVCGGASPSPLRTKRWRKGVKFTLFAYWNFIFSCPRTLGRRCSWCLRLQTQTEPYTASSRGSQAFGFGLDLYHQLPGASSVQRAYHGTSRPP